MSYPIEYYDFFVAFNEEDYYTCHDLLEAMWLEDRENYFLKGLLQMSVALYHYSYGNVKGAKMMLETAERYLAPYRPTYWGLNVAEVYAFVVQCLSIIPQNVNEVPFDKIDTLPKLPSIILYLEEE